METNKEKRSLKKGLMYFLVPVIAFSGLSAIKGSAGGLDIFNYRSEPKVENYSELEKTLENEEQIELFRKLKDRKELMKYMVNFELDNYELTTREKKTFNSMVNDKIPDYLIKINEASDKTGYPEEIMGGKIFKESAGNKHAYNRGSTATGILQILPSTYKSTKSRINWDIKQLKEHIPKEKLDELAKRSTIEQMMINPEKENLDFSEIIKKIGGKKREHEFYLQRLPVALMVYSEFDGKFPYNGRSAESTLRDPILNIESSAIIGTDYLLWLYAYQKKLDGKEFVPGKMPDSKLTVEALLNSYIAGIGDSQRRLKALYSKDDDVTVQEVSDYFTKNVYKDARHYNEKVQAAAIEFKKFLEIKEILMKNTDPEVRPLQLINTKEKYAVTD